MKKAFSITTQCVPLLCIPWFRQFRYSVTCFFSWFERWQAESPTSESFPVPLTSSTDEDISRQSVEWFRSQVVPVLMMNAHGGELTLDNNKKGKIICILENFVEKNEEEVSSTPNSPSIDDSTTDGMTDLTTAMPISTDTLSLMTTMASLTDSTTSQ